eukprot:Skav235664  [mRNA]  locus=scaffold358:936036:946571:+ [translate_table: standard]
MRGTCNRLAVAAVFRFCDPLGTCQNHRRFSAGSSTGPGDLPPEQRMETAGALLGTGGAGDKRPRCVTTPKDYSPGQAELADATLSDLHREGFDPTLLARRMLHLVAWRKRRWLMIGRVQLVLKLVKPAKLLLVDEVTADLDVLARDALLKPVAIPAAQGGRDTEELPPGWQQRRSAAAAGAFGNYAWRVESQANPQEEWSFKSVAPEPTKEPPAAPAPAVPPVAPTMAPPSAGYAAPLSAAPVGSTAGAANGQMEAHCGDRFLAPKMSHLDDRLTESIDPDLNHADLGKFYPGPVERPFQRPPGVKTLREWGQIAVPRKCDSKHKGMTFEKLYADKNYVHQVWYRSHVRAWLRSFQLYCRVRSDVEAKKNAEIHISRRVLTGSQVEEPDQVFQYADGMCESTWARGLPQRCFENQLHTSVVPHMDDASTCSDSPSICSVDSWIKVGSEEPCCFLPETHFNVITNRGVVPSPASMLYQGAKVQAANGTVVEVVNPPEQHQVDSVIELKAGNGFLVVSPDHRILIPGNKTVKAGDLSKGNEVILEDGTPATLSSCEQKNGAALVLRIRFKPDLAVPAMMPQELELVKISTTPSILSKGFRNKPLRRSLKKNQRVVDDDSNDSPKVPDTEGHLTD